MEPLGNINTMIDQIRSAEGPTFIYDEGALLTAYHKRHDQSSTLTIKILSVIGGVLATISFLVFLGLSGIYDSGAGMIATGIIFIAISLVLNFRYDKIILDTFSVTALISGLAMISIGLDNLGMDFIVSCVVMICIALVALYITQNFLYSFINVLVVCGSILGIIAQLEFVSLVHVYLILNALALVYIFLNEATILALHNRLSRLYDPIRIALIVSFVTVVGFTQSTEFVVMDTRLFWLSTVINSVLILFLVGRIMQILDVQSTRTEALIFSLAILIIGATATTSSISGAILLLLLSFMVQYRLGLVIAIVSLITAVAKYYYDLDMTLLHKSIVMFFTGVVFLLLFLLTSKIKKNDKEI